MLKAKILHITRYEKLKDWYFKYERLLLPGTLVFGFVVDAITFRTIDTTSAFILLGVHIVLAGSAILYINLYDAGKIRGLGWKMLYVRYGRLLVPFVLQLSFGALLSAAFIFYFFGGSFAVSWPFLIVIILLAFSNEIFRDYYTRPVVQIGMYYFTLLTVSSLIFPYILKTISGWAFVLASAVSMVLIVLYIKLLSFRIKSFAEQRKIFINISIAILVVMNVFYFYNVIPPVPLSVSEDGIYFDIVRRGHGYVLTQEKYSFWEKIIPGTTVHLTSNQPLYLFTAVRAPSGLDATIVHHWQRYNESSETWESHDRLPFFISGGRALGYRGYSFKSVVEPGEWRVDVETESGRIFGRVNFDVEKVTAPVETKTVER
ncbi:MAG: DUF2914 domain-containing protein [Patescibacteria group bacterium]